jgi:hypothetical protein
VSEPSSRQPIGAGIFALTGLALARTGPSLPLAFLAAVNRRFGTPHPANSMSYQ